MKFITTWLAGACHRVEDAQQVANEAGLVDDAGLGSHAVRPVVATNARIHTVYPAEESGQLPFLASASGRLLEPDRQQAGCDDQG